METSHNTMKLAQHNGIKLQHYKKNWDNTIMQNTNKLQHNKITFYIYSFSRRFYPKRLIIEEYNKRYIIKRQTDTGSACNTNF